MFFFCFLNIIYTWLLLLRGVLRLVIEYVEYVNTVLNAILFIVGFFYFLCILL